MNRFTELLDPITRSFLEAGRAAGGPKIEEMSVPEARAAMRASQPSRYTDYAVRTEEIPLEGYSLKTVRPQNAAHSLPALVYFPGGGWVLGGSDTHARIVCELALRVQCSVIVVDYARAPESPYPAAKHQCISALKYVHDHASALNIDTERIAIAGDSAGGNLAAAVALEAAKRNISLRLQALICPVVDSDFDTPSYLDFGSNMNLDRSAMQWFWKHYVPSPQRRKESGASPLRASVDQISNLAPAILVTAECDVLRDEAEHYARKLANAGINVIAIRYLGTVHNFPVVDALAATPNARACLSMLATQLQLGLKKEAV